MWRNKSERWSSSMFRGAAAATMVFLMAQGANAAGARGAGGGAGAAGGITPSNVTLNWSNAPVVGGDVAYGQVLLAQPAPSGGGKVSIAAAPADKPLVTLAPSSVTVPAGATSSPLKIMAITKPVSKTTVITILATYNKVTTPFHLTLNPNGVSSVSVQPATVNWGGSASGTVTLQHAAPQDVTYQKNIAPKGKPPLMQTTVRKGGVTVTLSGSSVTVPKTVKVLPGQSSAKFTATAPQQSSCSMGNGSPVTATVTATWETSAHASVTVGQNNGKPSRYTSNTIRIDPYAILGVSHDAQVIVLKPSVCANSLAAGDVMYIKKLGVLKVGAVKKVKTPSPEVAVGVSSASLTDFINDGTLQILKETPQTATEPGGSNSASNPWADTAEPYHEQKPGEQPWKYSTTGSASSYSFTAFKENNGLSASVTAKGQVDGGYNFLVVIHSDKLQQATFTVPTDGTLDVEWMAQTTASGQGIGESRLRMAPLYSGLVDDKADDIPFLFQIYANFIFKPGFGEKAAAKGHFQITYKGEGGIDGSSAVNNSLDATPDISSTTSSAKAPHGAVVAINAPKFAMTFSKDSFLWAVANRLPSALNMKGADLADGLEGQLSAAYASKHNVNVKYPQPDDYFKLPRAAYVQWVASVAYAGQGLMGAGLFSPVPCQQYYQNYLVQAGIDKDMLGSISGSIPPDKGVEVFKKTGVSAIPSIQGCMPKK
ncbi:MAG TPA: hypothetical protein VKS20_02460 [Candidatus Acidoferrales bacterium]|nr:hypothetical protein [Candidatus Acidoferrales bacterium]